MRFRFKINASRRLFAAEGQKLAGQIGGAEPRIEYLLHPLSRRLANFRMIEKQLAASHDDGQNVIQIMRNSARELPHYLHFLDVAQPLLGITIFGLGWPFTMWRGVDRQGVYILAV
jgi:hypothetical protein